MPLSRVLFGMERAGVLTDRDALLAFCTNSTRRSTRCLATSIRKPAKI